MVRVKFYYKNGCWVCDTVEEMLNGYQEKYGLDIERISIESDEELYELYRFDIPVLEFKDGSSLHGRIRKKDFLRKIEENRQ